MKKMLSLALTALMIASALCLGAAAEPSEALNRVYDAMTAEDSEFSRMAAMYSEYYEDVTLESALDDEGITITLTSANEYIESGEWKFASDGDYLTDTLAEDDFFGASMAQSIAFAAVSSQGVNESLYNGYLSALTMTGQENKYLVYTEGDDGITVKINIAGPFELEGIDELVLDEETFSNMGYEALGEDYTSSVVNFGKVSLLVNGSGSGATFLVMEYEQLDDKALSAVTAAAKVLQPAGWEEFTADYTELKDAETDNYTSRLNVSEEDVLQIIDDPAEGYAFAIITIGETY